MPVLVKSGRAAIASAIRSRPIFLALGTGKAAWDETIPAIDTAQTALVNEVGRRLLKRSHFVVPNSTGDIVVATGVNESGETDYERYAVSHTPTPHLHVEFQLDFADGADHAIRETGVFIDTELVAGLPEGQRYFLPEHIKCGGELLLADRFRVQNMSGDIRETFEYVITF